MTRRLSQFAAIGIFFGACSCTTPPAPKPQAEPDTGAAEEPQSWSGTSTQFSITSTPAGAAVRLTSGEKCKTPCTLKRGITENFDVTVSKNGFKSKTVSVISHQNVIPGSAAAGKVKLEKPHLSPNPLALTLEPVWDR